MNLILLGPPGAGKGTQGTILAERLAVPKIATGDLLRAAVRDGTPLGLQAQTFMDQGLLVPDEVILGLIQEVLASAAARDGVLMDGFPRTVAQAQAVDTLLDARGADVDRVLTFEVPEDELVARMLGRAADQGRSDDTPEAIKKRLAVFREQTEPLVVYYQQRGLVSAIDGTGSVDTIAVRVQETLGA